MEMRPFERSDFNAYLAWFADTNLNKELGPLDEEWLAYVLSECPPKEFCFLENGELLAVIGTESPNQNDCTWYITNIAVNPSRIRQGFGKQALEMLIQHHTKQKEPPRKWIAWVDKHNSSATRFFVELGWVENVKPDTNDMFEFSLEMKS